ncbi:hypothetical protein C7T94_17570 [Pedobacter yulinensis]|uniref:SCP domain-containing protein n=1 Tax=Pedobacter yulinensis TaxID=2126353 RepID=A0A2T3HHS8_9SPHI|nr:CAP domain-containing protein [Pedobacter yulinensis]PST81995.1 hypothetical protein C7T94_17570 [Pedobacter yulinensis]
MGMKCVGILAACLYALVILTGPGTAASGTPGRGDETNLNKRLLLKKVNQIRTAGCTCGRTRMPAVQPLTWNQLLAAAATRHSKDMLKNDFFDHSSADGTTLGTRVTRIGYIWSAVAENIAYGQRDEQEVFDSWRKSEGHCKNMMNARFREMGAGRAEKYWTQDFGTRR